MPRLMELPHQQRDRLAEVARDPGFDPDDYHKLHESRDYRMRCGICGTRHALGRCCGICRGRVKIIRGLVLSPTTEAGPMPRIYQEPMIPEGDAA